jgi:ribosomal protein S18 acetylase RimI-like enzyme
LANPDGWVYIAEVGAEAVGYVVVERVRRHDSPYTFARQQLMIDQISVSPACQGKGHGQELMQAIFDLAESEGNSHVSLRVLDFNTAAIGFYHHLGFEMFTHSMVIDLANTRGSV